MGFTIHRVNAGRFQNGEGWVGSQDQAKEDTTQLPDA
jgi:hypothetical protein